MAVAADGALYFAGLTTNGLYRVPDPLSPGSVSAPTLIEQDATLSWVDTLALDGDFVYYIASMLHIWGRTRRIHGSAFACFGRVFPRPRPMCAGR
jgi:hypothetical protein